MKSKKKRLHDTVSSFPRQRGRANYGMYRLISIVGILAIFGLTVVIGAQHIQRIRAEQELEDLQSRVQYYEARHASIQTEIDRLQDLDYIEIMARERLGLVKPGEVIFQVED